jgi:hypothetical protein
MAPLATGAQIPSKNSPAEIRLTGKEAGAMDFAAAPAMATATPATATAGEEAGEAEEGRQGYDRGGAKGGVQQARMPERSSQISEGCR